MPAGCTTLILGARGSRLARAQMQEVTRQLHHVRPRLRITQRVVRTTGDRIRHVPLPQIGQKGLFTVELEQALRRGDIDAAVHSYKDLALEQDSDLPVVAVLPRAHCADVLVTAAGDCAPFCHPFAKPQDKPDERSLSLSFLRKQESIWTPAFAGVTKGAQHGEILRPSFVNTQDGLRMTGGGCSRDAHDDKLPPLSAIPRGGRVGTSSVRRKALLLHARPDLRVIDVRGNVDTRLRRLQEPDSPYDALVLAQAGLHRLGLLRDFVCYPLCPCKAFESAKTLGSKTLRGWPPAPAQGALAIQCRAEQKWVELFAPLDHSPTRLETTAERALLAGLGGGCSLPIGAHARWRDGCLTLIAAVLAVDGTKRVDVRGQCACPADLKESGRAARDLGERLAKQALAVGGAALLRDL